MTVDGKHRQTSKAAMKSDSKSQPQNVKLLDQFIDCFEKTICMHKNEIR